MNDRDLIPVFDSCVKVIEEANIITVNEDVFGGLVPDDIPKIIEKFQ